MKQKEATMSNLAFLIPAAVILALAIVIKAILDNYGRIKSTGGDPSDWDTKHRTNRRGIFNLLSNLKWGFILAGLGFALILKEYVLPQLSNGGTFGLMFLCAGFGFFVYYSIAKNAMEKDAGEKQGDE